MTRRRSTRTLARDERGVSTTLGYVLNLTVATLVVTGLLVATGGMVDGQREQTIRTELRVIGQQLADDLVAADELAATAEPGDTVRIERQLPKDVAGRTYTVEVVDPGGAGPYLRLSSAPADVTVRIELTLETAIAESTVDGPAIVVRYADVDGDSTYELEVTDA